MVKTDHNNNVMSLIGKCCDFCIPESLIISQFLPKDLPRHLSQVLWWSVIEFDLNLAFPHPAHMHVHDNDSDVLFMDVGSVGNYSIAGADQLSVHAWKTDTNTCNCLGPIS